MAEPPSENRADRLTALASEGIALAMASGDTRAVERWSSIVSRMVPLLRAADLRNGAPVAAEQFVLGVDLDNVVFDEVDAVRKAIAKRFDVDPSDIPDPTSYDYEVSWPDHVPSRAAYEEIWDGAVRDGHLANMDPYPDATLVLQNLARLGIRIEVVTARIGWPGRHAVTLATTAAALDEHDIPYDAIHFTDRKDRVITDMHIDDADHHVGRLVASGRPVVLFHQAYNGPSSAAPNLQPQGEPQPASFGSLPLTAPPDGVPWVHPYGVGSDGAGRSRMVVQVPVARSWREVEALIIERVFAEGFDIARHRVKPGIGFRQRADQALDRGETVIVRGTPDTTTTEPTRPASLLTPVRPGTQAPTAPSQLSANERALLFGNGLGESVSL